MSVPGKGEQTGNAEGHSDQESDVKEPARSRVP